MEGLEYSVPAIVDQNNFSANGVSIVVQGMTNFMIEDNFISNSVYGVWLDGSGQGSENRVERNSIDYFIFGNYVNNNNDSYQFLDNCFIHQNLNYTDPFDVYIAGNGTVANTIGTKDVLAAGNCFTQFQTIIEPDSSITIVPFDIYYYGSKSLTYVVLDENLSEVPCTGFQQIKVPAEVGNYVLSESATNENQTPCSFNLIGDPNDRCPTGNSITEIKSEISITNQEIANLEGLNDDSFEGEISLLKECQWNKIEILGGKYIQEERFLEGSNYFWGKISFFERMIGLSLSIQSGDLALAKSRIEQFVSNTPAEEDYMYAQGKYIEFLENTDLVLSENEKALFQTKAQLNGPEYGQVKAIYQLITGEIIPIQEPIVEGRESRKESTDEIENNVDIRIFPNPIINGYVEISASKAIEGVLEILSMDGKVLLAKTISDQNIRINVSEIPSGLYFCRMSDENGIFHTGKVIITNN